MFTLAMAAMLVMLGTFIYARLSAELLRGVDRSLGVRADVLTAELRTAVNNLSGLSLSDGHRFADPDESFAQVLDPAGRILDATSAVATTPLLTSEQCAWITTPVYLTVRSRPDDLNRVLAVLATAGGRPMIAVVGETLGDRTDALNQLLAMYAIAGPVGLASTSAAGWLVAGATLRPVERIRRRAARLSHTDSRARLPVPRTGDELARLAVTLNEVLARLHAAVEREHRFVDEASHELRTPLAVLKAELDLASSRHRSAEELQVTVAAAGVQTDRLIQLAEDLLVLARARQSPIPPRRVPTHLPTLLHEVAASLRARTAPDTETIQVDADDVTVDIDPDQVHRAVRNLLDNALQYGGGEVLLTGRRHDHGVRIEVEDHGPGFPPALLASAFEPFTRGPATPARTDHRPGPSRARPRPTSAATAHRHSTGLGLAIVRSVAAAHGGTATATNADHGGARVRLHLMT